MKNIILTILACFCFLPIATAQDYDDPQNMSVNYNREADYAGGINQLIIDIWNKMEYTQEAINARLDGEVLISFDVQTDSTLSTIEIILGMGMGIDDELERVLKTLKFIPALADGNPVKMNMMITIPIRVGPNSRQKKQ